MVEAGDATINKVVVDSNHTLPITEEEEAGEAAGSAAVETTMLLHLTDSRTSCDGPVLRTRRHLFNTLAHHRCDAGPSVVQARTKTRNLMPPGPPGHLNRRPLPRLQPRGPPLLWM